MEILITAQVTGCRNHGRRVAAAVAVAVAAGHCVSSAATGRGRDRGKGDAKHSSYTRVRGSEGRGYGEKGTGKRVSTKHVKVRKKMEGEWKTRKRKSKR